MNCFLYELVEKDIMDMGEGDLILLDNDEDDEVDDMEEDELLLIDVLFDLKSILMLLFFFMW